MIAGLGDILFVSIPVSAISSQTWTSTADFDAGTKAAIPNFHFVNDVGVRGLNDAGGPSAVFYNGRTYVAYQSSQGTNHDDPAITYYDHGAKTWATPVIVGSNPLVDDGHGIPCMGIDSTGRIHIFFGGHASNELHVASTNPAPDISSWTSKVTLTGQFTYCHLETLGSTMWMIYRLGVASNPGNVLQWRMSTDDGATFGAVTTFADPGTNHGFYLGAGTERFGTKIWVTFNWLYIANAGRRHNVYVAYLDTSDGHIHAADGTDMGATANFATLNASALIATTYPTGDSETQAIHTDPLGNPYVIYSENTTTGNWRYQFVRWTGSAWTSPASFENAFYKYDTADFIVTSTTNVEAFLTGPGDQAQIYGGDIERWTWDGATWRLAETILTESRAGDEAYFSSTPHLKPITLNVPWVPIHYDPAIKILFGEFIDNNFNNIATLRIYAWGIGGFVPVPGSQGGPGIETTTDNTAVPAGGIQLASDLSETFANAGAADNWKWNTGKYADNLAGTTINTLAIQGGKLVDNTTSAGAAFVVGVISGFTIVGPDLSVNTNEFYKTGGATTWAQFGIFNEKQIDCNGDGSGGGPPGTVDGAFMRYVNPTTSGIIQTMSCSDGVVTQQGTNTVIAVQAQLCFRLKLVGTTWTSYYSTSATCASWIQDESFTLSVSGRLYSMIGTVLNGAATVQENFDDFTVIAGTENLGYRTSGSWMSPTFSIPNNEYVRYVQLDYSNVSATNYIDQIDILKDGVVVDSYTADITAGTSANVTMTKWGGGTMTVRVTLAGNGTGTPVLENVIATTDINSPLLKQAQDIFPLMMFITFLTLLMVGAIWIRKKRES